MRPASKKLTKGDRESDHTLGSMSNSRLNMNLDREVKIDFQLENRVKFIRQHITSVIEG